MAKISPGKTTLLPTLGLILAMLLWASSFIALKIAFHSYDPMVVIFGRMLVASICFLVVGKRVTHALHYRKGDYKLLLFMCFCEPCLYFLFEARALVHTTASQAGLITAILPVLVMIAASQILKEHIKGRAWLGAIIAVGGVCWLTLESNPSANGPNPILGNFYEFLAMICAAGYTISLKYLTSRYSPFFLTAIQAFTGCIFYFPLIFLPSVHLPQAVHTTSAFAIIYLGGVITLGAYGLYNYALKYVPANKAASYVNLIPLFSVILGWLFLGESLTTNQYFAAAVIIGGVSLSQNLSKKGKQT